MLHQIRQSQVCNGCCSTRDKRRRVTVPDSIEGCSGECTEPRKQPQEPVLNIVVHHRQRLCCVKKKHWSVGCDNAIPSNKLPYSNSLRSTGSTIRPSDATDQPLRRTRGRSGRERFPRGHRSGSIGLSVQLTRSCKMFKC